MMAYFSSPREAYSAGFFRDPTDDFTVRQLLGLATAGASEPGEVLATIARVAEGDHAAWSAAWLALGTSSASLGDALREAGHVESASGAYLRASTYLTVAMTAADDAKVPAIFGQYQATWESFIETTVYSVERLTIPLDTISLPGYLVSPSDDGEPRPTVILNGGLSGSHSFLWGEAAYGALQRGYNIVLFEGPGQLSTLIEQGVAVRPDWGAVLTAVVDAVVDRADIDRSKLAVYGAGEGGILVARALGSEPRLAAAVLDPGIVEMASVLRDGLTPALAAQFADGNRDAFDGNLGIALRFNADAAREWSRRIRPFGGLGFFDSLSEAMRYRIDETQPAAAIPVLITSAEGEQFWPGQSERLSERLGDSAEVEYFTAAEGASLHGQPLARILTQQRIFDWLDRKLGLVDTGE